MQPQDTGNLHVKNGEGRMVPLSAVTSAHWLYGSPLLQRYNGIPAVNLVGSAAPELSSGAAIDELEKLAGQNCRAGSDMPGADSPMRNGFPGIRHRCSTPPRC